MKRLRLICINIIFSDCICMLLWVCIWAVGTDGYWELGKPAGEYINNGMDIAMWLFIGALIISSFLLLYLDIKIKEIKE